MFPFASGMLSGTIRPADRGKFLFRQILRHDVRHTSDDQLNSREVIVQNVFDIRNLLIRFEEVEQTLGLASSIVSMSAVE